MNHQLNYRRSLPLGFFLGLLAIAAVVMFLLYAIEWSDNTTKHPITSSEQRNREIKADYAYQSAVVTLLILIVFFNGYHLTALR